MRPTVESKPITSLKPDPNQPRKQFNDDELRLLGESLKVKQIHPLLVRPDGTIIDGERRWRAAGKTGINALDVIVTKEQLTPSQIAEIQIISAMHREGLTGYEQWQAIERLVELNPGWHGKDIARATPDRSEHDRPASLAGQVYQGSAGGIRVGPDRGIGCLRDEQGQRTATARVACRQTQRSVTKRHRACGAEVAQR